MCISAVRLASAWSVLGVAVQAGNDEVDYDPVEEHDAAADAGQDGCPEGFVAGGERLWFGWARTEFCNASTPRRRSGLGLVGRWRKSEP